MDLLSNLLDVRVHVLHLDQSRGRGYENIFIHRAPDTEQQKAHQHISYWFLNVFFMNIKESLTDSHYDGPYIR